MSTRESRDGFPEPFIGGGGNAHAMRARLAIRRMQLRNPNHGHVRAYPVWKPGMHTSEYIRQFEDKNSLRIKRGPGFTHAIGAAPWNEREPE